jgi:hypothetical protein
LKIYFIIELIQEFYMIHHVLNMQVLMSVPVPPSTGYLPGVSDYDEEAHKQYMLVMEPYWKKLAVYHEVRAAERAAEREADMLREQAEAQAAAKSAQAALAVIINAPRPVRAVKQTVRMDL